MQKYFDANQHFWNQTIPYHLKSELYDMDNFLAGKSSLMDIESQALGDVSGKSILHLQCHFGQDSLSWARKGAKVTGVDFSEEAIKTAKSLNQQLKLNAEFICCNIYDLEKHLDKQFDIVFTSYGVLMWLPDLPKWASLVERYLKADGIFYIVEFHPFILTLEFETTEIKYPYFHTKEPYHEEGSGSYADRDADIKYDEYGWGHSLAEITQSLLDQDLLLKTFKEYPYSPYNCFPNMRTLDKQKYVLNGFQEEIPHLFSLKMLKPS